MARRERRLRTHIRTWIRSTVYWSLCVATFICSQWHVFIYSPTARTHAPTRRQNKRTIRVVAICHRKYWFISSQTEMNRGFCTYRLNECNTTMQCNTFYSICRRNLAHEFAECRTEIDCDGETNHTETARIGFVVAVLGVPVDGDGVANDIRLEPPERWISFRFFLVNMAKALK